MENRFLGNYRGIVISNDDPERIGRVQVFVPSVNISLFTNWRELEKDLDFKFIGENVNSTLNPVIKQLKELLPWAEMASPMMGECSVGRYNANQGKASPTDDPNFLSDDATNG